MNTCIYLHLSLANMAIFIFALLFANMNDCIYASFIGKYDYLHICNCHWQIWMLANICIFHWQLWILAYMHLSLASMAIFINALFFANMRAADCAWLRKECVSVHLLVSCTQIPLYNYIQCLCLTTCMLCCACICVFVFVFVFVSTLLSSIVSDMCVFNSIELPRTYF